MLFIYVGGGKTTLVSTLSLRLDPNYMDIQGEFRLNGREYSRSVLKAMSAYVMQDDLMHAELTVEETLTYSAELRMNKDTTSTERKIRVEEVMELMGITHCRDVIIGDSRRKGISGGERKRVSVGIEILSRPKLVFLDEPTSSLDSSTAYSVCLALKNLSDSGECTVVCTIHQPQPKIFNLFDNLILMRKGQIVYQGQILKLTKFLEEISHPCPHDENMADHLLNIAAPSREDVEALQENANRHIPVNLNLGLEKPFYTNEGARSWRNEFVVLFRRSFHQYLRRYDIIAFNFFASLTIAFFIGFGFWYEAGLDGGQQMVKTLRPSLFFAVVNQGVVGSFQAVTSFPAERAITLRERAAGTYQVSSYFMAKTAVDVITLSWPPVLVTIIVYFAIGYQATAEKFFIFLLFLILDCLAATSLATLVVCTCVSIERSTVVLTFLFEASRLFGGYYTSPKQLDDFPNWAFADALSYIKYAYIGVALNEFHGLEIDCPTGQTCATTSGGQIIAQYGYDRYTIGGCVGYLIVLIIGFRLLAYLGLRYFKT